ncbi:MAG: cobaltochelatase subunit CobN, partial [Rhodospirillaceae bacterium]|nr:cobaltochelatase subunit CobN [Rhodospirillaceae bacterium]
MHLLAATPGAVSDGSDAIDLGQSSGDVVFLSAADTELAVLSHARSAITDKNFPSLRLASLLHLSHNMSVDLYMDQTLSGAKLIIVRLLGGRGYWPYGIEQLSELARKKGIMLALLPGDDQPDAELVDYSTLSPESCHRLWQYCVHGGPDNAQQFLRHAASLVGVDGDWREPTPLLKAGIYGAQSTDALKADWTDGRPVAALVFYRALMQAGNLAAVDGLVAALGDAGLNVMPLYVSSLKDPVAAATLATLFADASPDVILNATGFAVSTPGADTIETPLSAIGVPVLQVVFSGSDMESWRDGQHGLSARDIAMNVALPEVDGNVLSRAVSFKGLDHRDDVCEADIVTYTPVTDRIDFVARLAAKWAGLRNKNPADRKVAIILANYPNRDGRIG